MRFAVAGTGMMGCEHIRNLTHIEDAELVGIADSSEKSRQWGVKACSDHFSPKVCHNHHELIELQPDAIIIATPNFTHRAIVGDLAQTGIHLLVEKPMCTTLDDAKALHQIAEQRDALTWIALEYRYMPTTTEFLRRLPDVGDLKMLFIREHRFPFLKKVDNWNRFNEFTGGTLVEKCCHFFDLMNLAVGTRPVRVMASGGQDVNHLDESYDGRKPDILDNAYVIVEYEKGVRACLDLCMFAEGSRNEQELVATGSIAKLEAHIPDNVLTLSTRAQRQSISRKIEPDPKILYAGLHHGSSYLEQVAFIDAIRNNKPAAVSTADGYWSVAVGIAAQTSIETGATVEVQPL